MSLEPGDVFAIKVDPHSGTWDRTTDDLADKADTAASGVATNSNGQASCGSLFAEQAPRFSLVEPSLLAVLAKHPDLLNDQLICFYGPRFTPDRPATMEGSGQAVYGIYRTRTVEIEGDGDALEVIITPYADGWAKVPLNMIPRPRKMDQAFSGVQGLHCISRSAMQRLLELAANTAFRQHPEVRLSPLALARLRTFAKQFETWADIAAASLTRTLDTMEVADLAQRYGSDSVDQGHGLLAQQLQRALTAKRLQLVSQRNEAAASGPTSTPDSTGQSANLSAQPLPDSTSWRRTALPESSQLDVIDAAYGQRTLKAIRIALATKPLLLLTGPTGAGKSWLAGHLIDDPTRERIVTVPVSSSWRGRDDFLGYVNPITGEFEPSEFTLFLKRAERAWNAGDHRSRVAILEEFSLSPPEHWLSDLLVRLEYAHTQMKDRTIVLGGTRITGWDEDDSTQVYLPPTLRLVGTLNQDHTVRRLSPRVLDRAALVELSVTTRSSLVRAGLSSLSAEAERVVDGLASILAPLGIGFSVRTASSLRATIEHLGNAETMSALDHVLVQEVLSKVHLNAGDYQDEEIAERLLEWTTLDDCRPLERCIARITRWSGALRNGRDVLQA